MLNFDFYNPTKIVFGRDRLNELDNLIKKDAKVLILYGGGSVKKFGTLEKVMNGLGSRKIFEFGGIEPNPKYETLMKAVEIVKREKIDFLLAVGGGSVMDGTKFIALAACYEEIEASDILFGKETSAIKKAIPIGMVVTLPATGSEMNRGGVITFNYGKWSFYNDLVFPKFSILDPTLTFSLPKSQVANGIVDTFVHVCEQYMTYPVDGRFQDRTSEGILKTLIEIGKITVENPTDYNARANLVWCATMGLNGLIGAGVPVDWSTHRIGHEITAMFEVDHAKTLAIVLPSLWNVTRKDKHDKLVQYAERVWNISSGSDDEKIDLAIEKTREFFEGLGIKTHLSDYGIQFDEIEHLVKALKDHGRVALSETGKITLDVSRKILEGAI